MKYATEFTPASKYVLVLLFLCFNFNNIVKTEDIT